MKNFLVKALFAAASLTLSFTMAAGTAFGATPLLTSAKVTSPTAITLIFSEAVNTTAADYSSFTGDIYDRTLASVSGSGTSQVTLNFTGSPFKYEAIGNLTVASTTVSVSDSAPFVNGNIGVTDGQIPKMLTFNIGLTSNSYGDTLIGVSDVVTLSFTSTKSLDKVNLTVDGAGVSPQGSGTGPYILNYNKTTAQDKGTVPFVITLIDKTANTNSYSGSFSFANGTAAATVVPVTPVAPAPTLPAPAIVVAPPATVAAAPAPAKAKFTKFLSSGMSDPEVLELQKRLVAEGFLNATPTGKFGPLTLAAVKAYQKAHNLDPLGYVGPGTRAALNAQ